MLLVYDFTNANYFEYIHKKHNKVISANRLFDDGMDLGGLGVLHIRHIKQFDLILFQGLFCTSIAI